MESKYNYFKRDISWLSFNYRVLLEALDERLPLYERINFISIYSSNLEEFYKIRVADHKAVASGATESDEETVQSARELVEEINKEVTRQLDDRVRIYEQKILPALRKNHIIFYQDNHVEPFHQQFIKDFFREEIFPYLQPVPVSKDKIVSFLRDNRLYLAIRVYPKKEEKNKGEETKENIEKYTGSSKAKCNRPPTTPLLCDETTLRQSAPLHRTSVSREKSLFDVYRRHHQGKPQPDLPRLRCRLQLLYQNFP